MIHPYANPLYLKALSHIGRYVDVPAWGTGVLVRPILKKGEPTGMLDAIGPYPITALALDADIPTGLDQLRRQGLISVTLVLDEWHRPKDISAFSVLNPFKTHFIHRGHSGGFGGGYKPHKNHARQIAKAKKEVSLRYISLEDHLPTWCAMYADLADRRGFGPNHRFSADYFKAIAGIPGFETIAAFVGPDMVAANIWACHNGRATSHLVASTELGYETHAAYAMTDYAMMHFGDYDIINLGGCAGNDDSDKGLAQFKSGFSNAEAKAVIAGAILDIDRYGKLCDIPDLKFFPAYRG